MKGKGLRSGQHSALINDRCSAQVAGRQECDAGLDVMGERLESPAQPTFRKVNRGNKKLADAVTRLHLMAFDWKASVYNHRIETS